MPKRIFISYSHKDEEYREALEEHLAILNRNHLVSIWHDRKITSTEDWKSTIDENLEGAEIIIFLVSPSFLASPYCYDVEVKKAMEQQRRGSAKIFSIIVRPCDWHECEFSKFQAAPKDARAISSWEDKDSAWLDVVHRLKDCIANFTIKNTQNELRTLDSGVELNINFDEWLYDTEIVLTHRKVDRVKLNMIYVSADMQIDEFDKKQPKIVSSDQVFNSQKQYLIYGEEQQGKTTLLKNSYLQLLKLGFIPIYLEASQVKTADLEKVFSKALIEQYKKLSYEQYCGFEKIALLIDNFDNLALNQKFKNIFIDNVTKMFGWIIATCHNSYNFVSSEMPALDDFYEARLLGFGNLKREEVVRKWVQLGVEESIQEEELYARCDEVEAHLNTVIKRNIVPPKPVYVLMLIQMFEAYNQQNIELTSYGHCYQQLIYQSFEKANINSKEYEKYLNVLTEFSWARFKLNKGLNEYQLEHFFEQYGEMFLPVNGIEIVQKLLSHSILSIKENFVEFKYPYIYYFFVARKIAEGFGESEEIKGEVENLFENLHREDFANILIFITHHTKDNWVLHKISDVLSVLFQGQSKASLAKSQLSFMDEFIKQIPDLVIEKREVHEVREEKNRKLDEIEGNDEQDIALDILAKINKTFKGMEIAGQIIRNRHASMKKESIYKLADSGVSSGLRFLDYFLTISDEFRLDIVKHIESQLIEYPNLTNREIQHAAEKIYLHHTYMVLNGVIRKIASSIGSKEAKEIYKDIEDKEKTPAYTLINLAIELQFTRSLNMASLIDANETLKNNVVCLRIMKEIVIQHIYMFPVEYKVKQQLSEMLDISVYGQRLMDNKKQIKA